MAAVTYSVHIDWDNDGSVLAGSPTAGEDVSARVLNTRTAQSWSFGRDTQRSLSSVKPGQVTIELNNISKDYSPDNASSPLYGSLAPGKPILIKAVHNAITYNLFWGFIDDYSINPYKSDRSVTLTCIDALGKLATTQVSTACYESIQTGAAIGVVLDAAGWSATARDLDAGSTTLRYWCADQVDAWSAILDIVNAEGSPAIAYSDASANFAFRDRHHRKLDTPSLTSQATFRDTGTEPLFSDPAEYNIGFRDLINTVEYKVEERGPDDLASVWSTDSTYAIGSGDTVNIEVHTEDPFIDAVTPEEVTDYQLVAGSVEVTLSRTSGQTSTISIFATSASVVTGMSLRAYLCPVQRELIGSAVDPNSVTKYGISNPDEEFQPKWLGLPDAQAIGARIVAQRGERLPVFTISVKAANDTRKVQLLGRKISDMITIVEAQTGTNHTHFIEKIENDISQAGKEHTVQFGCERVQIPSATQFQFDVAGAGFDQGSFGVGGYDDAATIFILDSAVSGHRLGTGKLAT